MAATGNGSKDLVFVTYAHEDERWKDMLLLQFKQLERLGELSVWDDRDIKAGENWYARIKEVLGRTKYAVCLISANFLNSAFCMEEEMPYLLQQQRKGGIEIVPILVEDCVWQAHRWLKRLQMLPRDGQTVAEAPEAQHAKIFAAAARQVWESFQPGYVYHRPPPEGSPPEKVDISRLPETGELLFGRSEELNNLDAAWRERQRNVVVFRASGGVGKSTLVRCWAEELAEDNFLGAERVFAWSFYSQGTGDSEGRQGRVPRRTSSSARRWSSSAIRPAAKASRPGIGAKGSRKKSEKNGRSCCSTAWSPCSRATRSCSPAKSPIPALRPWCRSWPDRIPGSASSRPGSRSPT